jgi:hypothetical protein
MPRTFRLCLAVILAFAIPVAVYAKPTHKQALATHLGPYLSAKLNACTLCHLPDQAGAKSEDEEKPHNRFGARLKVIRAELKKAGKKFDIPTCFDLIAEEDSDGDGVPNLIEILTGHNPGDPNDKPTPEEVSQARQALAEYRKFQLAYPWRPFESVRRPVLPQIKNSGWARNPIDFFIAAEHESLGLRPRPEADKASLLRRVYFDLIGLPPTPDELHSFLNDPSSQAYDRAVDRLLESPHYGERWGRHWMDVWRYSDWAGWTDGKQIRDSQPHIWRWRDWIIESLNADKGYDRMILEMFAADELCPEDENALRATGYLARNYKMLSREKWLQDTVDHTFLAFQGVTIGCARCHDHMYDPILQKEYYQVRAVFTPHQVRIDRLRGEPDTKKDGLARVYDAEPNAQTFLLIRGDDRNPDKAALEPGVPQALGGTFLPKSINLPASVFAPERREFVVQETVAASAEALSQARRGRGTATRMLLAAALPSSAPLSGILSVIKFQKAGEQLSLAEADLSLAEARHDALLAVLAAEKLEDSARKDSAEWKQAATAALIAQRQQALLQARRDLLAAEQARRNADAVVDVANADAKLKTARTALTKAEAEQKAAPSTAYTPRKVTTYSPTSSGRRLAFAKWLADRQNPLTARVAGNHIWLRHFGQALAPSVFDFGRNGRAPSHPALLDWLAAELMEPSQQGDRPGGPRPWSMKHLHRLIVTSATYCQASTGDAADAAIDRDNKYLWHMQPRRLEAELVRDHVLFAAGRLDTTMSGPEIEQNLGMTVYRRSLYFRHAAEKEMEFLKLFDAASVTECYQRKESVIPQQALALFNSDLTVRMARILARDLAREHSDPTGYVTALFERTLSRPPGSAERDECLAFLEQQTKLHAGATGTAPTPDADGKRAAGDPALRARENLAQVLFNHHEFVTVR